MMSDNVHLFGMSCLKYIKGAFFGQKMCWEETFEGVS